MEWESIRARDGVGSHELGWLVTSFQRHCALMLSSDADQWQEHKLCKADTHEVHDVSLPSASEQRHTDHSDESLCKFEAMSVD